MKVGVVGVGKVGAGLCVVADYARVGSGSCAR